MGNPIIRMVMLSETPLFTGPLKTHELLAGSLFLVGLNPNNLVVVLVPICLSLLRNNRMVGAIGMRLSGKAK